MDHDPEDKKDFKQNLSGYLYQLKILMLFSWRGKNFNKFHLGTELEDAEKFDDAVFSYEKDGENFIRYVQAKYSRSDGAKLTYSDFVTDYDRAKCNLKKYFISYRKIKQRTDVKKIADLILCTNIAFPVSVANSTIVTLTKNASNNLKFLDVSNNLKDEFFYDSKTKKEWKKYQLQDVKSCKELVEKLHACSNLNLLASELAVYLFKDTDDANLDFKNYWISAYFNALMKEKVVVHGVYRFAAGNQNPEKPQQIERNKVISELKTHFIAEMKKQKGKILTVEDFINIKFEKCFIDSLNIRKRTETEKFGFSNVTSQTEIDPKLIDVSTDMKQLAEALVKNDPTEKTLFDKLNDVFALKNEYVFSDNFIYNNADLSQNAKLFRSILLKHCEKHFLKSTEKQEFITNALYENSAESGESTMKEEAKKLIDHIFYKKDLSDVCESKYLKNVLVSTGKNTFKFTKDYTTDPKHQGFREIFIDTYFEEMLKKHVIKFKQNFSKQNCFKELIKEFKAAFLSLLQNTVTDDIEKKQTSENDKLNCQSLVEKKTGVIKIKKIILEKYDGFLEALNGSIFVSSKKRNRITFTSEFFNSDESQLNSVAQEFKNEFKKEFKKELSKAEMELLKNFEIEYANYPPYFDKLEENADIDKEIEEFRKLLFIVNTPNEIELMENISFELGEKFNLLDSEMITNKLFQEILNFSKQNEECFITSDSIMLILEKLKVEISKKIALGCTVEYCHKLGDYGVEYIENLKGLINFLDSRNSRIFHLTTNEILLTAIKVAQTLKSTKFWKQRDCVIFNSMTSLLRMEENTFENGNEERHVSKTFDSIANLLIIVDNQETEKDIDPFGDRLYQILCKNAVKKIVIIGNKTSPIALALMHDKTKHLYSEFIDKTEFDNLTQGSQSFIRKEKKVIFQGNIVTMNNLIDSNEAAVELIDSETLQKLIKGDEIIIGKPIMGFTELEQSYYHKRKFRINEIDSKVFKESEFFDNHIFAIEGTNVSEFLKSKNIGGIKILHACDVTVASQCHQFIILEEGDAKLQYNEICKKCPGNFIHWLKLDDNTLVYFCSYIPISKKLPSEFVKHIQRNKKCVDESDFYEYVKQNQVVIIADKAGMGKTTVLNSFSKTLIELNYWNLRINLNQYTETLSEINKCFKKYNISVENICKNTFKLNLSLVDFHTKDYGKLALKSLINNEILDFEKLKFEDRIFNYFFTKNKMLFIFDGFDEINPDYGNEVILLIRKLVQNENNRIWITSRTNFKETLEMELNTFAYDMKPFDENDQRVFIKKFWLNSWKIQKGFDMPNQDRLSVYIETLIDKASKIIGDIIGIPLQTKMLAEIFQENHDEQKTWTSCFEYVENVSFDENMLNISAEIENAFLLYERFFEEKLFKYFLKDKLGMDWSKSSIKEIKDFKKYFLSNSKRLHKLYGFIALCDNKAFTKDLFTEEENNLQLSSREETEKIGIIDSFNSDNIPLFTHLTYAEYFCSSFLIDKLWNSPAYAVFQVINEILKKDVAVFVECLLYKLKHESNNKKLEEILNGKSVLKYVIHHQFLNCVKLFLSSKDFNDGIYFNRKDIICYAAEFGNKEIFLHIVFFVCQVYDSIDFIPHLCSYVIDLNRNLIKCETINLFLKDIFEAAKNQPKIIWGEKENHFNEHFELTERYILMILRRLFKYLSSGSIFNLLKMFKHLFVEYSTSYVFGEICIRNDITINEKIKISKLICDNKKHVIAIFGICVEYDCHDLLKEISNDYEFTITNKNIISLIKTAVKCNMHEITIILFEKLKIDGSSEMDYLIKCVFLTEINLELLKQIVEKTILPLNKALLAAIKNNCNVKIIKFLIENGAKPDIIDAEEESAWTLTVKKNDDDKILKIFFDNFNSLGSKNMKTTLKEYFEKPIIMNDESRLIQAIEDRDNLFCHFLLRRSTNPKLLLFRFACYDELDKLTNQTYDVKELIEKYKNIKEHTLWHVATKCNYNNIGIWKSIINKQDLNGNIALHFAVQHSVNFSERLLFSEVCYNIKNNDGKVPADLINGDQLLTALFNKIAAHFNAAEKNNFDFTNDYDNRFINVKNEKGNTFLHYAVMNKNNEAVSKLLFQNADITIKNNKNRTPLYYAVKNNDYDMVTNIIKIIGNTISNKRYIVHDLTIFDEETYTDVPKNECTDLLLRIKKCLDHFNNEKTDALINTLEFFGDNEVLNGIVNLCKFFGNNYTITKYLLQKGLKIKNRFFVPNRRITKAIRILNEMVYIVKSKKYEPESIVNYFENNVKQTLCNLLFIDEKNFANKIIANFRFDEDEGSVIENEDTLFIRGGTLLHLSAAQNEEKLVEWLLEIGANPYTKTFEGNDIYEIAKICKSQNVLQILPAKKKIY